MDIQGEIAYPRAAVAQNFTFHCDPALPMPVSLMTFCWQGPIWLWPTQQILKAVFSEDLANNSLEMQTNLLTVDEGR